MATAKSVVPSTKGFGQTAGIYFGGFGGGAGSVDKMLEGFINPDRLRSATSPTELNRAD